jgi:hypothetical protein
MEALLRTKRNMARILKTGNLEMHNPVSQTQTLQFIDAGVPDADTKFF